MKNPAHRYTTQDRAFWPCFNEVVRGCSSALEIGCGEGNNLRQTYAKQKVGIECFQPYVKEGDGVEFRIGDALKILPTIPDKSFELILNIDCIEHFYKEDAIFVMKEMDRICSKRILLWTPSGLMVQNKQWHDDYRQWSDGLEHKSSWVKEELEEWGYDVAEWFDYHLNYLTKHKTIGALFATKDFL